MRRGVELVSVSTSVASKVGAVARDWPIMKQQQWKWIGKRRNG